MKYNFFVLQTLFLFFHHALLGQVFSFTTQESGLDIQHRILMDEDYLIATQFLTNPNRFIKTIGGFYEKKGNEVAVKLEFNSDFSRDSLKHVVFNNQKQWKKISNRSMPLQGKWLMAGRMVGDKERKRDINRPRKTMKFLFDGYFQWIAYNTESFSFHGTGGGKYTAERGEYTEIIDYFSRDNNKVGISLKFEYATKGLDWHHKGFSSKGDPLHEIWTIRIP